MTSLVGSSSSERPHYAVHYSATVTEPGPANKTQLALICEAVNKNMCHVHSAAAQGGANLTGVCGLLR